MKQLQLCPWCQNKLEEGTLRSRGGNYFLPLNETIPATYMKTSMDKSNAISLPPYPLGDSSYPKAFVCRHCGVILIPYERG